MKSNNNVTPVSICFVQELEAMAQRILIKMCICRKCSADTFEN